ncbi:MAG: aminopeptidase N [Actinomycetaceae bacterium]|nr:aminopeptidase N [Actinomycetaceae bacterium]
MPGTNLTRAEATERAAVIATDAYRVHLDLSGQSDTTFSSVSEIDFTATPGAATFLDVIAESVERVTLNGVDLDPAAFADSRFPLADLQATNTVRIESTMRYSRTGEGLHRYVDPADSQVYLYSQFEVADARRMFACFEQPDLKATFVFTVDAPSAWTILSTSPTPEPQGLTDGVSRWVFAATERISTYLTSIIAGPYQAAEPSVYTSVDGRDIPLGIWARKSLIEYVDADNIYEITRQGFEFYEANYGHPYPFQKYDQIFCPEYNMGAMEHPGNVTIVEDYIFRTKPTAAIVDRRVITILHEQAHMWFGNLVTMKWWDDLWLNESFAEYMSHLAAVENTRWKHAWTTFLGSEKSGAIQQDLLPSTHPVAADIRDIEDVLVNFDQITYGKGASVLKQLVAWVGLDAFLAGVRSYIAKFAWGNATLADLLTELEAASGRDLANWTKLWIEEAGANTLFPEIVEDGGTIASFAIVQGSDGRASLRPHRIGVGGFDLVDGRLVRTFTTELDIDGERTEVAELAGKPRPDLLLINDFDHAYAKIRLDEKSLATAIEHLDAFEDRLARTVVLLLAWDMCRDAQLSATDYVAIALKALADETDGTVMRMTIAQLTTAVNLYSAPATRDNLASDVAARIFDLVDAAGPGSDAQLQLATAAMRLAVDDQQFDRLAGWLDGRGGPAGLRGAALGGWVIVVALASAGKVDEAGIAAEYERDASSYGQYFSAQARGALPDEGVREQVWREITGAFESNAVQRGLALGTGRARAESLVPYAERYFADARAQWDTHSVEIASNMLEYAFPIALAGRTDLGVDLVALGEKWLADNGDAAPACVRLVSEQVDRARRAVQAQEADAAS